MGITATGSKAWAGSARTHRAEILCCPARALRTDAPYGNPVCEFARGRPPGSYEKAPSEGRGSARTSGTPSKFPAYPIRVLRIRPRLDGEGGPLGVAEPSWANPGVNQAEKALPDLPWTYGPESNEKGDPEIIRIALFFMVAVHGFEPRTLGL